MKKIISVVVIFTLLLFVLAVQNTLAGGWGTHATTITGFYIWSNGNAHFNVVNPENPDKCANHGYLTLDVSAGNFDLLFATLIIAYNKKQAVKLSYSGCTAVGSHPVINSIAVPDIW